MEKTDSQHTMNREVKESCPVKIAKIATLVKEGSTPTANDFFFKDKQYRPISAFNIKGHILIIKFVG